MSDILTLDDLPEVTETQDTDLVHIRRDGQDKAIKNSNFAAKTTTPVELAEAVSFGDPVAIDGTGKGVIGDSGDISKMNLAGVAIESGAIGETINCQKIGGLSSPAHGYTIGEQYYLGGTGTFVTYGNLASDYAVPCFMVLDANTLDLTVSVPRLTDSATGTRKIGDLYPSLRPSAQPDELAVNGSTFVVSNFQTLANSIYVGDSLNATADYGYRCDNADGTSRNTAGAYMKLPDMGGVGIFGLGANGDILMADGNPYDGGTTPVYRLDQMQQIEGTVTLSPAVAAGLTGAFSQLTTNNNGPAGGSNSRTETVQFDSADSPNSRTGVDTHGAGVGTYWYIKALEVTGSGEPVIAPVPRYESEWTAVVNDSSTLHTHNFGTQYGLTYEDLQFEIRLRDTTGSYGESVPFTAQANASGNFGQAISDNVADRDNTFKLNIADSGPMSPRSDGGVSVTTWDEIKVIAWPKIWTQTAIAQNLGGYTYDLPESGPYDLSSPQSAIDLNTVFAATPGSVTRYSWMNGDGTNALLFNGGDYTGKTVIIEETSDEIDAVSFFANAAFASFGQFVFITKSATELIIREMPQIYVEITGCVANGSAGIVTYSTENHDDYSVYNLGTGVFTAPVSGNYTVNATIFSGATLSAGIRLDGAPPQLFGHSTASGLYVNISITVRVTAGQTIEIYANAATSSASAAKASITRVG